MKKTRSILSALTVMAMLVSVPASVSAADSVSLIAGRATAKAGEEFSVDVKLSGIPSTGMSILDFAVEFDSSILTISDVTDGGTSCVSYGQGLKVQKRVLEVNIVNLCSKLSAAAKTYYSMNRHKFDFFNYELRDIRFSYSSLFEYKSE